MHSWKAAPHDFARIAEREPAWKELVGQTFIILRFEEMRTRSQIDLHRVAVCDGRMKHESRTHTDHREATRRLRQTKAFVRHFTPHPDCREWGEKIEFYFFARMINSHQ